MDENNRLIFKKNSNAAPAEYAPSFAELNFNQTQFKFNSSLHVDTNKIQFKNLDRKIDPLTGIDQLNDQLTNEEKKFKSQCEFIEQKTNAARKKIVEFYMRSNADEISCDFQEILYEETKKDLDKQEEKLKNLFEKLSSLKQNMEVMNKFKDEINKAGQILMQEFDTNILALSSTKQKLEEIKNKKKYFETIFKKIDYDCFVMKDKAFEAFKIISAPIDPIALKQKCDFIYSDFSSKLEEFKEFKYKIVSLLKQFNEDYIKQTSDFEAQKLEYKLLKENAENLKKENFSTNKFIEQTNLELEVALSENEKQERSWVFEIKNLEDKVERKNNLINEKSTCLKVILEKLKRFEEHKRNLITQSTKISLEFENIEKDIRKLDVSIKAIDKKEMSLTEKATQMRIELAVQSTLKQEHRETNQLLLNKIEELRDMNARLKKTIEEKRIRNQEKKNKPFADRPQQRNDIITLEDELKEITKLHSEIFKDDLPDFTEEFKNYFGPDFEIFDPSFNQVLHSLTVRVSNNESLNSDKTTK